MQLLRRVWSFGSNSDEMVQLWKPFCLDILDQYCDVWNNAMQFNAKQWAIFGKLMRPLKKKYFKLILEDKNVSYFEALQILGLQS